MSMEKHDVDKFAFYLSIEARFLSTIKYRGKLQGDICM